MIHDPPRIRDVVGELTDDFVSWANFPSHREICRNDTQDGFDSQQVNMCPHHGAPVGSIRGRLNSLQHAPLLISKRRMKLGFILMFQFIMLARFSLRQTRGLFFYLGCVEDKSGVTLALCLCDAHKEQWWILVFVTSSLPRRIRKIRLPFCNPNNSQTMH